MVRCQGALANLGHKLTRNTIANILKRHGMDPTPERSRKTTWKEFLNRHLANCRQRFLYGGGVDRLGVAKRQHRP